MVATLKMIPARKIDPALDFMHTISRDLTHKRRLENVYVTSTDQVSETEYVCGAFVPQANVYLNGMRAGPNDVTLTVVEIGRQIGIALCHAYMGVGRANVFILNTMQFETVPAYHAVDWVSDDMLSANAVIANQDYRVDGGLCAVHAGAEFFVGDQMICRMHSDWTIQPLESGRRLREIARARNIRSARAYNESPPPFEGFKIQPIFPVKRTLLGAEMWVAQKGNTFAATLEVDLENLFFFDHENDHVPGMLILEGMRQLAVDVAMRFPRSGGELPSITRVDVGFKNFAEIDHPVVLVANVEDRIDDGGKKELYIRVEAQQFGKPVSEGRFIVE